MHISLGRILSLMGIILVSTVSAQAPVAVERPELRPGESWSYVVSDVVAREEWKFTREIEARRENDYATLITTERASGVTSEHSTFSFNLNRLRVVNGETSDSGWLQFPLTLGKSWKSKELWISANGTGYDEMTYVVAGTERITVPAGTFDTIHVQGEGRWTNTNYNSSDKIEVDIRYAPALKAFVRFYRKAWYRGRVDSESTTNLVAAKVSNGETLLPIGGIPGQQGAAQVPPKAR